MIHNCFRDPQVHLYFDVCPKKPSYSAAARRMLAAPLRFTQHAVQEKHNMQQHTCPEQQAPNNMYFVLRTSPSIASRQAER